MCDIEEKNRVETLIDELYYKMERLNSPDYIVLRDIMSRNSFDQILGSIVQLCAERFSYERSKAGKDMWHGIGEMMHDTYDKYTEYRNKMYSRR